MSIQAMKRIRAAMALYAAVLAITGRVLWLRHIIPWPMGASVTFTMLTLALCLRTRLAKRSGVTLLFPEAWSRGSAATLLHPSRCTMEMNDEMRNQLEQRLRSRRAFDKKWASRYFAASQVIVGASIFARFGSAAAAALASDHVSKFLVALLAVIPGTVIIIDQSCRFADRWRWHNTVATRYSSLEDKLKFQSCGPEEVSREMNEFLEEMEKTFPIGALPSSSRSPAV